MPLFEWYLGTKALLWGPWTLRVVDPPNMFCLRVGRLPGQIDSFNQITTMRTCREFLKRPSDGNLPDAVFTATQLRVSS